MIRFISRKRCSPIGVDLGSRSIKLLQLDGQRQRLHEAVRWDLPLDTAPDAQPRDTEQSVAELAKLLRTAREGRSFRGREAVLCLGGENLHVQNLRVVKSPSDDLQRIVYREAAGRIPFPIEQAELRFIEAGEVRQGAGTRLEVIVLATPRPALEQHLQTIIDSGLRPVAVEAEPIALLRCYVKQFRRDQDRQQRTMFVHMGVSQTLVVIAQGTEILFIKYIDVGGRQMDEAVAQALQLDLSNAAALRRHNVDRRADQQDPEVTRSISNAVRPVLEQLASELSMCARYHSVTFRGAPLVRLVLGGGEATSALAEGLANALNLPGELGNPLRSFETTPPGGRLGQWDIATGLALRPTE